MKVPDRLTPSQTVGPFFTLGLTKSESDKTCKSPVSNLITGDGEKISIIGRIMDGNQEQIHDALIEIWQSDSLGKFDNPLFVGFARSHSSQYEGCLLYTSPSPRDLSTSRMPSSA